MSLAFNKVKKWLTLYDTMPFGKYQGMTVIHVIKYNPRYLRWMTHNSNIFFLDEVALDTLERAYYEKLSTYKYASTGARDPIDYDFEDTIEWDNIWH